MGKIKSGIRGLILLVIASSALFLTCDIGLGRSVDTKPPALTIAYPPVQSVIKNAFTMSGKASDETALASVSVTAVNTVTAVSYGPYSATIDPQTNAWSLVVNNRVAGSYELRDGTYQFTATATDGAGRKTVATTTYEIDNTAPVVVIDRPGTYGPIQLDPVKLTPINTETYGTELKLTGSINDDHAVDKLVFTAYDEFGTRVGSPITQTNISGVAMDITLARYSVAPTTAENITLNNIYRSIYTASDGTPMGFYCTITVSDAAREFNPPAAVASADNSRGNVNSSYYIYDDIYSTVFSATGYAVTMKDLTAIFNGSYADAAKAAAVRSALASKARPAAVWSTASATFSLSPQNNPSYKAQGYEFLSAPADIDLPINQIADNTDLTLIVSPGRDGVSLDKDSFAVSIVPCGASGATPSGDPVVPLVIKEVSTSGKNYLVTVTVDGDPNVNYLLAVAGADMDGNVIDNGSGNAYGFKVVINGLPPTIAITAPTLNSYTPATTGSHTVTLSGTVTSENGTPILMLSGHTETKVDGTKYTIVNNALFDRNNPATYQAIPVTPSGEANKWNWSYTIDTTDNLSVGDGGNGEDLYTYDIVLNARNLTNTLGQATHVFFVDSALPTAELVSVNPTTSASPPPYAVNGIIGVTLRFADNDRIASASYRLGSDPVQTIPSLNGYTISGIDTRNYDGGTGTGMLPLTVTLTDRAGLQRVYKTNDPANDADWVVNIDQSLDNPVLAVNYANPSVTTEGAINATTNLYGRDGYTAINGTVTDDDGAVSVIVTVDGVDHAATVTGSTYSYALTGLTPGYHDVRITAIDGALGASASIPGPAATFKIAYDTDLPNITIGNADNQFQPAALQIAGTVSDSSSISSFTCSPSGTIVNDVAPNWHVDIAKPAASEVTTLTFTAKDAYGRTATKTFTYKYDLDIPTIAVTTALAVQPARNYFNQNYALTVKGTAQEAVSANPQSGLAGIEYVIVPGLNASLPGTPTWLDATGSASWVANVDLTDSGTFADGDYTVFLRSVDLMGNASTPLSYTVTGDRVAPTLSETEINTSNTVYRPATFDLGGAVSDAGSGIASFAYTRNGGASVNAMALISSGSWTLPQVGLADGTYSYVITAKDGAGISSTVTRTVTIDNTKPVIGITSPSLAEEGQYITENSYNFKGNASDTGSGVNTINLTINGATAAISPVTNWTSVQDLTGLTEGATYAALLEVSDNAGNTETATRNFKVDRAAPRATVVPGATANGFEESSVFYRETAFALSGTCDDAAITTGRKATSVVLSRSKDGGPATKIASTIGADGVPFGTDVIAAQTWTYSQAVNAATHADDGLYVYTLVVTDDAGRSTTATATVRIDTTAPTVVVTAPTASESVSVASYTLQGNATDLGSGIDTATLEYTLDGGPATDLSLSGASWTAAAVSLGAEGSKALAVTCADRLGNPITAINVTFYYDLNKPELDETEIGSSTLITNAAFDLGGTCLDTNRMKQIDISATRQGVPAATKTWTWPAILKSGTNLAENWTQNITLPALDYAGTTNGTYTFTIVATDIAGKTTTVQRTVIVDTVAPSLSGVTSLTGGWRRAGTQSVTGTITDPSGGSGVDTVQYAIVTDGTLDSEPWYSMTVSGTTFTGSVSFADGSSNQLLIKATDRAGNFQQVPQGMIWIDSTTPSLTVDSPIGVKTVNGKSALQIVVTASDATSGLGSLSASYVTDADPYNAPDTWSAIAGVTIVPDAPSVGQTTITIPAASLATLAEGSQKAYLRVPDAAGNYSTVQTVNLLVDTTAPTGSVTSHGALATVNKTITIGGTANDVNGVASVTSLEVWTGGAGAADPDPEASSGWTAAGSGLVAGTYGWSASAFNTVPYSSGFDARSDLAGEQICVRVAVTDSAGNVGHIMRTLTVDQDSDRPVIKLSNVNPDGTTTLKLSGVVYGTVSDDDGVTLLEISTTGTFSADASDDVSVDGGAWSFDAGGTDGTKELYFRVTDSKSTVFTTVKADDASVLAEPKIQYQSSLYSSSVSYRVDTIAPETYALAPVVIDRTSAYDFADASLISTNMPLGGGSGGVYSKFRLRVLAKDANGIASVVATIPGVGNVSLLANGADGTDPSFTRFDSDSDTLTVGVYEPVDVSGLSNGAITIGIVVTDNSGLTTTLNRTVLIDNAMPTVTHSSPRHDNTTDVVNGDAVVKGVADDGTNGSGIQSLSYQTGLAADRSPTSPSWKPVGGTLFSWQIDYKAGSGTGIDGNKIDIYGGQVVTLDVASDTFTLNSHGFATGTAVYFGGGGTLPTGMAATATYYAINTGANAFRVAASYANAMASTPVPVDFTGTYTAELSVSKFSKDVNNNGFWELPILLRAEDNAGNVYIEEYTTYIVHVDPSGDRPKISIVYPDPAATNRTMGGTIRIFGTAIDDDAVGTVYMQIDANGDNVYDGLDDDYAGSTTDWYNGGIGQAVSGTASWNQTINSTGEFNPKVASVATIKTGVSYRIVAPGTTTFDGGGGFGAANSLAGTEFIATRDGTAGDGSGTIEPLTRTIHFRVRAQDIYNVNGAWSASQEIVIDKNVPKIGSTEQLGMTQGATNRTYVADMYVRDDWTFTGSIEDESGISAVTVSSSVPALNGTLATGGWFTPVANFGNGNSGYRMSIPITTSGTGSLTFTITATDNSDPKLSSSITININYDNEAPTLNAYLGATPVAQSNKAYELKASVNETGSGFDKLAFYFERNVATDALDRVYNPMETRAGDANRTYLNTLTTVEGLPSLAVTGAARSTQYSLTSVSIVGNLNVRVGGLVSIGGLWRYILTVNHATGTITWADAVDVSVTNAYLAYAMVVNNTTVETPIWTGSTLTGITNDDGDFMVEAVERSGGLYSWTASINSANIPDGPIEIHYVAFDKAGNHVSGLVTTSVQNNRPKLASVILGTDLNGDGDTDDPEDVNETATYSALDGSNNPQAVVSILSSAFIAKGLTTVTPTIIGGNGELQYTLKVGANTIHSLTTIRADEVSLVDAITVTEAQLLAGTIGEGNKNFLFTIWDSTEETTPGSTSQYAELTVPLVVDAVDGVAPSVVIQPFYWNGSGSAALNSLYGGLKANGHIDIPQAGGKPQVSGQISVRGTAFDDQRVAAVYVYIGNQNLGTTSRVFADGRTYYLAGTYSGGTWTGTDLFSAAQGWKFSPVTKSISQDGHAVTWKLDWDTSKLAAVAATDVDIRVECLDRFPNEASSAVLQDASTVLATGMMAGETYSIVTAETGSPATPITSVGASANVVGNIFTATAAGSGNAEVRRYSSRPLYTVDVVPYITKLARDSSYNTIRSRQGRYVLRRNENVTVSGFNLFHSTSDTISLGGASQALPPSATKTSFTVAVPASARSGDVSLTVNGVVSGNNLNVNARAYNVESDAAIPDSDLWNDDRKIHVWQSDDTQTGSNRGYFTGSIDPEYPAMTSDSTGVLYGSWSNYATSSVNYVANNANFVLGTNRIAASYDPLEHTDIAYGNRPGVVYNANTFANNQWNLNGAGGVVLWDSQANGATSVTTGNGYEVEYLYHDRRLMQFINQRVAYQGDNMHVAYYDTETKALKYWYSASASNPAYSARWINIDGGYDAHDGAYSEVYGTGNTGATITTINVANGDTVTAGQPIMRDSDGTWYNAPVAGVVDIPIAVGTRISGTNVNSNVSLIFSVRTSTNRIVDFGGASRTAAAGEYCAIDTTPTDNYPVIAYYDITNRTVKIARATAVSPTAAQWSLQNVMLAGDDNFSFSGKYVAMKIDSLGYVHLAFYRNSTGDLIYVKSTNNPTNGATPYTFGSSVVLDSTGSVGIWIDMTLKGNYPYVSYLDSSYTYSFDGVKLAYYEPTLESLAGDAAGEPDTRDGWEYMNATLNYEVEAVRTSIENDRGTNFWGTAVGYSSSDYFRIGYYVDE